MGWKCSAETRTEMLASAIRYVPNASGSPQVNADVAIIDVNSWARTRHMVGKTPPSLVAKKLVDLGLSTGASVIVFCWDTPDCMLPARAAVARQRSARQRVMPPSESVMAKMTGAAMPCTWEEMLAGSRSKAHAYATVFKLLQTHVLKTVPDGTTVVTRSPVGGEPWVFPRTTDSLPARTAFERFRYGEADAQVVLAARQTIAHAQSQKQPVPKIAIFTFDTDMLLQLHGIWPRNILLVWAKVYRVGDVVHRTKKKLTAAQIKNAQWEMVDMNRLIASRNEMASRLFWFLLIKGVDYCTGICKYGWTEKCLAKKAFDSRHPVVSVQSGSRTATVDLNALRLALKDSRHSKRLDKPTPEKGGSHFFVDDINRVLFCMRYYLLFDSVRPDFGGPVFLDTVSKPAENPENVSSWVSEPKTAVTLTDEFPSDFSDGGPQACHPNDEASLRKYET